MPEFLCELCGVHVNSQDQLAIHKSGQKHLKKLKAQGLNPTQSQADSSTAPPDASKLMYGKFVAASPDKPPVTPLTEATPSSSEVKESDALPTAFEPKTKGPVPPPYKKGMDQLDHMPGLDPVQKAVVGNALGKLPTKRKAYDGRCEYCNVDYTSESHEYQHLSGAKHHKKKRLMDATRAYQESLNMPLGFTGFTCQYCNVMLNTMDQYEVHRKGQKHKKNLELLKKMGKATEESKGVIMAVSSSTM